MPPTIYAILLAAGRSTRMGQSKPLLPWGQSTVIESCVDHLFCGGVQEVTVVLNPQSESIMQTLASTSVGIAINDIPNCEMGVSISRGAEQLPAAPGAILLALADQPAVMLPNGFRSHPQQEFQRSVHCRQVEKAGRLR